VAVGEVDYDDEVDFSWLVPSSIYYIEVNRKNPYGVAVKKQNGLQIEVRVRTSDFTLFLCRFCESWPHTALIASYRWCGAAKIHRICNFWLWVATPPKHLFLALWTGEAQFGCVPQTLSSIPDVNTLPPGVVHDRMAMYPSCGPSLCAQPSPTASNNEMQPRSHHSSFLLLCVFLS
jgi:hypothetical protein